MTLSIDTLHFSSAITRCAYLIVFIVTALSQGRRVYLWYWAGAMATSAVGSTMVLVVGRPHQIFSLGTAVFTYALYAASIVFFWGGIRRFHQRSARMGTMLLLILLPSACYAVILAIGLPERLALTSVFAFCMLFLGAIGVESLRRLPNGTRLWSQYIVSFAFGAYFLVFLFSIGILIFTDIPVDSKESGRLPIIVDQLGGVFIYFGCLAMTAERANTELIHLAGTDPLTGLSNRRMLQDARARKASLSSVLIADIDHFKSINDRYGHAVGDAVLVIFAQRLRGVLRSSDFSVRWGGEEFLAILPGLTMDRAALVAERLRAMTEQEPFSTPAGLISVTVSLGVAETRPDEADLEPATQRADTALYAAKTAGRNRVHSQSSG